MHSLYIHIPICKSRCAYCAFYSTTALAERDRLVRCLLDELQMRSDYLPGHTLKTIYFGGGTPSLLDERQITLLTDGIHRCFQVSEDAEISIEANPGDIDAQKLHAWRTAGINRLSLGVQSFDDSMLHALGRRHDAQTARQAICMAQAAGFGNISIDL
ncbi:MAG: radical SAM protein, partial [Paludibacteraceae bacterium]|nr:radical SAM protein [Paludibacteraceae bacterium]